MPGETVFQVGLPGQPEMADVLGLWQPLPPAAGVEGDGSLWRADLPGDLDAGDALLEGQAARVAGLSRAMPDAASRLRADLSILETPSIFGPGGLGFSLDQDDPDDPRGILSGAWQVRYPDQAESFGALSFLKPAERELAESVDLFGRFTRQVQQTVSSFATVETVIGGRKLGRTRAGWSGDLETWWRAGGLPGERAQHEQVLAQALATRQHWLRFLLLVAGGVTQVAAALAAGPFSPLAIWTSWNYFQKVLKAYREAVQGPAGPA